MVKCFAALTLVACLASGCAAMDAACFAWSSAMVAYDVANGIQKRVSAAPAKQTTPTAPSGQAD